MVSSDHIYMYSVRSIMKYNALHVATIPCAFSMFLLLGN